MSETFLRPPHWVESYPAPDAELAAVPGAVVVDFNFSLHRTSTRAEVTRDGTAVPAASVVSDDRYSLRMDLDGVEGDGTYVIDLDACWPDGSCHPGRFQFTVDSSRLTEYEDRTGLAEVDVRMADVRFDPARLIVSPGTTIRWTNEEPLEHFVNSDPHPGHGVLAGMNSPPMEQGDVFSFRIDRVGEWGFHCSAHRDMVGRIVVRR